MNSQSTCVSIDSEHNKDYNMNGDPAKAYNYGYRSLSLLVAMDIASHLRIATYIAGSVIPYQAAAVKRVEWHV